MNRKKRRNIFAKGRNGSGKIVNVQSKLHQLFSVNDGNTYGYQQLVRRFGLKDKKAKEELKNQLFGMEKRSKVLRTRENRYVSTAKTACIQGKVEHVNPRFAYVVTPEGEEDIRVKTADLKYAVHGDTVKVVITRSAGKSPRPEGKVIEIVNRDRDEFVGIIDISTKYSFVVPDNRYIHLDILVYPEKIGKANPNDKVLVKIIKWHDAHHRSPVGKVMETLGQAGENETEIHSIMAEFRLPFRFTQKMEEAADAIPDNITEEEIAKRWDFRPVTTFTIDPDDAKDFDDAISIRELQKNQYEVGVHIADVSHYVKEGSLIDSEAIDRATSVYLVDRTIPMLPERLSNDLCSLRPKEEKLTFSAVFHIESSGKVTKRWFGKTIIKSNRRFTYEEAQARIEGLSIEFAEEINILNGIAKKLKNRRFENGAINFETPEVTFELDERGKPLKVIPKERKDAHKLIEEFMLLANREVATYISKCKEVKKADGGVKTFVYRVHDEPDPEKINSFAAFAAYFGYRLNLKKNISQELNRLIDEIVNKPEQNVLEALAIRSMAKAIYATKPDPHFGLAFDHYTHFTSPIRRYPDIMVHRLLQCYLNKGKSQDKEALEALCRHSSAREKRAVDAERASVKYKQVEFMQKMLNHEMDGIVSGVTEWGIFVQLIQTKCEGMIRLSDLDDDFYEFDEKNYRVIGRNNKQTITLGDQLRVLVVKTNIDRRTIDLMKR